MLPTNSQCCIPLTLGTAELAARPSIIKSIREHRPPRVPLGTGGSLADALSLGIGTQRIDRLAIACRCISAAEHDGTRVGTGGIAG